MTAMPIGIRMKRVICISMLAMVLPACSQPGIDVPAEKAILEQSTVGLAAAEAERDLDRVMSYWAEDAVAHIEGMPEVKGKSAIRELMGSMLSSFKEFEGTTTRLQMAGSGDLAYEYGVNRLVFAAEEADLLVMGKYLAVWTKVDGIWRIAAISVTNDSLAPAPIADSADGPDPLRPQAVD